MLLETGVEGRIATHDQRRHCFGHLVADCIGVAEHSCGITHCGSRLDGGEGHDLRHMIASVFLGGVADHLVAVARVEVHIDIGHGDPAGIEEPLKQQVVTDGIEISDAKGVGHGASGGRTASGTDTDSAIAGMSDEIPDDEEVGGEPHIGDDLEFIGQSFDDGVRHLRPPPLLRAFHREVAQVVSRVGESLGEREVGKFRFSELDLDITTLGDPQRVVAGLGDLGEQSPHLGRGLEVVLIAGELEPIWIAHK